MKRYLRAFVLLMGLVAFLAPSEVTAQQTDSIPPTVIRILGDTQSFLYKLDRWQDNDTQELKRNFERENNIRIEVVNKIQWEYFTTDDKYWEVKEHLSFPDPRIDIFEMDIVWTPEFIISDWALNLDPYLSPEERQHFFSKALRTGMSNDELFAIPLYIDVGLIFYYAGNQYPNRQRLSLPAQLDRAAFLAAVRPQSQSFVFQGRIYEGLVCNFFEHWIAGVADNDALFDEQGEIQILSSNGVVTLTHEAAVDALTFMVDMIYDHQIAPQAVLGFDEGEGQRYFYNHYNQRPFLRNWPYILSERIVSTASLLPRKAPYGNKAVLGGWNLFINKHSNHPDKAWKVIEFLTSEATQRQRMISRGSIPSRINLLDAYIEQYASSLPDDFKQYVLNAKLRPVRPDYHPISEIMRKHLHRALRRETTPEEALAKAADEIKQLIR